MKMAITNERLLGLLAFVVAVAYSPDASVFRWSIAAFGLCLICLMRPPEIKLTGAHLVGGALFLYASLSMLWTTSLYDGGFEMLQWELVGLTGFLLGASISSMKPLFIGLSLGVAISLLVGIGQLLGYQPVFDIAPPAGLFGNRDPFAEIAALALVGCVTLRIWWACPAPFASVLIAGDRTVFAAIVAVAIVLLARRLPRIALTLGSLAAVGLIFYIASLPEGSSVGDRWAYWRDTIDGLTPFGRGIGSFYTAWPQHTAHYQALVDNAWRPDHAHNDFLEAAFELGVPGVLLLGLLFIAGLGRFDRPENLVFLALAVECLAAFPLHYPATLMVGFLALGRAAATGPALRWVLHGCRMACGSWMGSEDEEPAS